LFGSLDDRHQQLNIGDISVRIDDGKLFTNATPVKVMKVAQNVALIVVKEHKGGAT